MVPANARPVSEAKDYKWVKFIRHERERVDGLLRSTFIILVIMPIMCLLMLSR